MNYAKIDTCDFNNGSGIRITLWVSGCPLQCDGCHNQQLWDKSYGSQFDEEAKNKIMELLDNEYISGLSILGGEPLAPYNIDEVISLCKEVNARFPEKDIWLWTGYDWDYVTKHKVEYYANYIICGKFIKSQAGKFKYFGSSNQKIYFLGHDITKRVLDKESLL